jgi:hypothetical protein
VAYDRRFALFGSCPARSARLGELRPEERPRCSSNFSSEGLAWRLRTSAIGQGRVQYWGRKLEYGGGELMGLAFGLGTPIYIVADNSTRLPAYSFQCG